MSDAAAVAILRSLAAGTLTDRAAAEQLARLDITGFATGGDLFTPEERRTLGERWPAVQWEVSKLHDPLLPDVVFGSPDYHACHASIPRVSEPTPPLPQA